MEENQNLLNYNLNINDLGEKLICPICLDFFKNPILDKCGHSYCEKCFLAWISKSDKCPMSLKKVDKTFSVNLILKELVNTLILKCKKCENKFFLENLKNHDFYCELENMKKNLEKIDKEIDNLKIRKDLIKKKIVNLKIEKGIKKNKTISKKKHSFFSRLFWSNKK